MNHNDPYDYMYVHTVLTIVMQQPVVGRCPGRRKHPGVVLFLRDEQSSPPPLPLPQTPSPYTPTPCYLSDMKHWLFLAYQMQIKRYHKQGSENDKVSHDKVSQSGQGHGNHFDECYSLAGGKQTEPASLELQLSSPPAPCLSSCLPP